MFDLIDYMAFDDAGQCINIDDAVVKDFERRTDNAQEAFERRAHKRIKTKR